MWYVWFAIALLSHLGISAFCAWRFRFHTAFCTVPKPEAFANARALAATLRAQCENFKPSDLMVFSTTKYERWSTRPWVGIYFFAGFVILTGTLVLHLIRA